MTNIYFIVCLRTSESRPCCPLNLKCLPHLQAQLLGTSSTTSTAISTASTQVSATVTPVTTSGASGVSLQSTGSAETNSVEAESRFMRLLVVLASFFFVFLAFVLGRFVVFRRYSVCTSLRVAGVYSLGSSVGFRFI